MLKKIYIVVVIVFSTSVSFSQSITWKKIEYNNPEGNTPMYNIILDCKCFDDSTCIALLTHAANNVHCIIKRTSDGGKTWNLVHIDTIQGLVWNKITSITGDKSFITGTPGRLLSSKDRGLTWEATDRSWDSVYSVRMTDDFNGLRFTRHKDNYDFIIEYTCDGGNSWNIFNIPEKYKHLEHMGINMYNKDLFISKFSDKLYFTNPFYVRIEDNLSKWTEYNCPDDSWFSWTSIDSINHYSIGKNIGSDPRRELLYFSGDGCKSWTKIRDTVNSHEYLLSIAAYDKDNIIVGGDLFTLLRSKDGGKNWILDALEDYPVENQGNELFISRL